MRNLALTVAALLASGCGQLYVDAEVRQLCQRLPHQVFQVPQPLPGGAREISLAKDFAFDLSVQVPEAQRLDHRLRFSSFTITASGTTPDLGFVDAASVTLASPPGSSLKPLHFEYARTQAAPTNIAVAQAGLELGPYLTAGALTYAVTLDGRVPEQDVTVDIEACAALQLHVDIGP